MVNSVTGESMLQITVDQLARTLCASAVLGAPVEAGDRVIIPVAEFGFGFGGGEGTGGSKEGSQNGGSATGGGGGISAVALIIITKSVPGPEGIQVMSLKKKSEIAEVITTIGETVGPHVAKALEKGSEMMMQRKGSKGKTPWVSEEGKEIPVSGEEEA
ncbi:MAG: spore germination protein GerW family protein [Methanoculleus sp.]|nr:spore germination protein GerW family protein [Methanoculleus sp.]